jgi:hypothetical protein
MRIRYSYQYGPPRTKPHDHMYTVQSYKNVRVWSEVYKGMSYVRPLLSVAYRFCVRGWCSFQPEQYVLCDLPAVINKAF